MKLFLYFSHDHARRKIIKNLSLVYFVITISIVCSCSVKNLYIVRHGEKSIDCTCDPPLSKEGVDRSAALNNFMDGKRITKIYSTNTHRTIQTAIPVSHAAGEGIFIYDATNLNSLINNLKADRRDNVLVVGHSNTIIETFTALGGVDHLHIIDENDFDNMLIIRKKFFFGIELSHSSEEIIYGASSP